MLGLTEGGSNRGREQSYLGGGVDGEQRDGVHAAGRGDVEDHAFGPGEAQTSSRHFLPRLETTVDVWGGGGTLQILLEI